MSGEVHEYKETAERAEHPVQSKKPLPELRKGLGRNKATLFQLYDVVANLVFGRRERPFWIQNGN